VKSGYFTVSEVTKNDMVLFFVGRRGSLKMLTYHREDSFAVGKDKIESSFMEIGVNME